MIRRICSLTLTLFFLLALDAQAAIYVDNAASGCSNGSTAYRPANRDCSGGSDTVYTTLNNAHTGISAGTSGSPTVVNIRSGITYKEQITISKDYTTWQKYSGDASKPIVDGEWARPSLYYGLFTLSSVTGVVIDGLEFRRAGDVSAILGPPTSHRYSNRHAIRVTSGTGCTVQNCYFNQIGDSGVITVGGSGTVVQDSSFFECGTCAFYGEWWSGAVHFAQSTGDIARRNKFYGCWGENIQFYEQASTALAEYNVVVDTPRVGIYFAGSVNCIARYNLVYHTMSNPRYISSGWGGYGIAWGFEGNNSGGEAYGNLIAGGQFGFRVPTGGTSTRNTNMKLYNNTFVEANSTNATTQLVRIEANTLSTGNEIKNNIFFQTSGTITSIEDSGATWANNLWNKVPSAGAQASSDPGYPTYSSLSISDYFQKTSGWTSLTAETLTGQEFALRSTATNAIDVGATLSSYANLLNLSEVNFLTGHFPLISQATYGSAYDIGAGPYPGDPVTPVDYTPAGSISRAAWTCTADSEEATGIDGSCENAFDGLVSTAWHTAWTGGSPAQPHTITIALGDAYDITDLRYVPCFEECSNGTVDAYTIYTSTNGTDFTERDSGTWSYTTETYKDESFAATYEDVTHVRFVSTSAVGDTAWTAASEIFIVGQLSSATNPQTISRTGITATASTYHDSSGTLPGTSLDGDGDTGWFTDYDPSVINYPHWIKFDFGSGVSRTITHLLIVGAWDADGMINAYTVDVSANDSDWTEVHSGNLSAVTTEQDVTIGSPAAGRYLRITATSGHSSTPFACLREVNFQESASVVNPLAVSNLSRTPIHVLPGVPVIVQWDYTGDAPPTTCTLNGTEVTCSDKQAFLTFTTSQYGYHDVTLNISNTGENDTEVLDNVIFVGTYPASDHRYSVCATPGGCDFSTTVAYDSTLGPPSTASYYWVDNVNIDFSALPSGWTAWINGPGYGTLTGRSGLTFRNGNWIPGALPTMGNNVEWGDRVLPLMNWTGTGGIVPDDTVFFGNGTGIDIDLSGLDMPEGQSCYVRPRLPHGALTFDVGADLGECSTTCTDRRLCVHPDHQRKFFTQMLME